MEESARQALGAYFAEKHGRLAAQVVADTVEALESAFSALPRISKHAAPLQGLIVDLRKVRLPETQPV